MYNDSLSYLQKLPAIMYIELNIVIHCGGSLCVSDMDHFFEEQNEIYSDLFSHYFVWSGYRRLGAMGRARESIFEYKS